MGCIGQVGPDAYNARRVALAAGLPVTTPAFTVNRLCGSGLQAVWSAALQIRNGDADVVLAGGDENMSRLPFLDFNAREGYRLGDRTLLDGTMAVLTDPFLDIPMGATAEAVARKYGVSRAEQDEFAAESQRRATSEVAAAAFAEEIVPVEVVAVDRSWSIATSIRDRARPSMTSPSCGQCSTARARSPRATPPASTTARPLCPDPGQSPQPPSDCGRSRRWSRSRRPRSSPSSWAMRRRIAIGTLLDRHGLTPKDLDTVELNEAFAAQAVAVIRDAKLDPERTNPYGGAIALGHPVGATGAILTVRAGPRPGPARPRARRRVVVHRRGPGDRCVDPQVERVARECGRWRGLGALRTPQRPHSPRRSAVPGVEVARGRRRRARAPVVAGRTRATVDRSPDHDRDQPRLRARRPRGGAQRGPRRRMRSGASAQCRGRDPRVPRVGRLQPNRRRCGRVGRPERARPGCTSRAPAQPARWRRLGRDPPPGPGRAGPRCLAALSRHGFRAGDARGRRPGLRA